MSGASLYLRQTKQGQGDKKEELPWTFLRPKSREPPAFWDSTPRGL